VVDAALAPAAAPVRDPNDGTKPCGDKEQCSAQLPAAAAAATAAAAAADNAAGNTAAAAVDAAANATASLNLGGDRVARSDAVGTSTRTGAGAGASDDADAEDDVYLYVAGGRNRGQTVGVTERYSLRRRCWERGPHITEPRGSHGGALQVDSIKTRVESAYGVSV
jgi:hypothetical protein